MRILVGIEIPSSPSDLDFFTLQAVLLARDGRWSYLTVLFEHKILAEINNRAASMSQLEKELILTDLWQDIVAKFPSYDLPKDSQYENLSSWMNIICFGRLFTSYQPKISAYIYRRTSDQIVAEDLTSDTFDRMINAIKNKKYWRSSFSGWIFRIAHNLVIDHYRARDRHRSIDIDQVSQTLVSKKNDPFESTAREIDAETLYSLFKRLTEEQALVIKLRFIDGMSSGEIAVLIDKTEGSVKALQHRGLAALKQLMLDKPSNINMWTE